MAAWVDRYGRRLEVAPAERSPLTAAELPGALGQFSRRAAWVATFRQALAAATPAEVVAAHWALLGPGLAAAGWHGLLRTAHALASPGAPGHRGPGSRPEAGLDVERALARLVPRALAQEDRSSLLHQRLAGVAGSAVTLAVVEAVDLAAQPVDAAFSALAAAAARAFVNEGTGNILLLHAVTGTAAARLLGGWLPEADRPALLRAAEVALAG